MIMMIISYAISEKNQPLSQDVPDEQHNAELCAQEGEYKLLHSFSSQPRA